MKPADCASAVPSGKSAAKRLLAMQRSYGCIPGIGTDLNRDVSELLAEHGELQRAAKILAVLALQSERHSTDEEFRLAVGGVLAITREVNL
jgi:hypothetical protein